MVTVLRPVLVTAVIYKSYPRNNDCVAAAARGTTLGRWRNWEALIPAHPIRLPV